MIGYDDVPRDEIIALAFALFMYGHNVYVGSGGGTEYARMICDRLGMEWAMVVPKYPIQMEYDLCSLGSFDEVC